MTLDDLALTLTPGLGPKGVAHLLDVFGSAAAVFAASEEELRFDARLRPDLAKAVASRCGFGEAEREAKRCRRAEVGLVAATDPEYPELLRDTVDRPHVLYVRGAVGVLRGRLLSAVGTRRISAYGQRVCHELVAGLAARLPDLTVVSGLAFGVDAACHRAALDAGLRTLAVVPAALPGVVPAQHSYLADEIVSRGGALVSELPSSARQNGTFYLARNRIIAGLSPATLVVESPEAGGSLHTAACADSYGRTVLAVPGRITDTASRGTNALIRNRKAQAVLSADDILRELMWDLDLPPAARREAPATAALTPGEEALLGTLPDGEAWDADRIVGMTGLSFNDLSALLTGLELAGRVRRLPGNRYEKL